MSHQSTLALLTVATVLLLAPASASLAEDSTAGFVSYQFDGGTHHDAPDRCAQAAPTWELPLGGTTDGLLVPPDDLADHFVLEVTDSAVGKRLSVEASSVAGSPDLAVSVYLPGCGSTVLDLVNWPTPEPSPPAPAAGEQQHSADVAAPEHCDSRLRLFVLDRMAGLPSPPSIHLAWTDGSEGAVPLAFRNPEFAAYSSTDKLGITLKGAWANVHEAWAGDFRYAVGPCDAVDGGAVYGDAPTLNMGVLSFTPTRSGPYVVQVALTDAGSATPSNLVALDPRPFLPADPHDAMHGVGDAVGLDPHDPVPAAPSLTTALSDPVGTSATILAGLTLDGVVAWIPSFVIPMSCHMCVDEVEEVAREVGYRLTSSMAA
jgi:hypothetical protein